MNSKKTEKFINGRLSLINETLSEYTNTKIDLCLVTFELAPFKLFCDINPIFIGFFNKVFKSVTIESCDFRDDGESIVFELLTKYNIANTKFNSVEFVTLILQKNQTIFKFKKNNEILIK